MFEFCKLDLNIHSSIKFHTSHLKEGIFEMIERSHFHKVHTDFSYQVNSVRAVLANCVHKTEPAMNSVRV